MPIVVVCSSICIEKFVYVLAKLQTTINFAPIIKTGQILYQFGIKYNFLCNANCGSVVVCVLQNLCMF